MSTLSESAVTALQLTLSSDPVLWTIVGRSLSVSATACLLACGAGLVLGFAHLWRRTRAATAASMRKASPLQLPAPGSSVSTSDSNTSA